MGFIFTQHFSLGRQRIFIMKSLVVLLSIVSACSAMCIWNQWLCNREECGFYGCSYGCHEGYCASSCMGACAALEVGKYPEGCCTECKEWCYLEGSTPGEYAPCSTNSDCTPFKDNQCEGACNAL